MDNTDWDSVFQYVSEPLELELVSDKMSAERQDRVLFDLHQASSQVPTPPLSNDGSPLVDSPSDENSLVSVSTTFYPGANTDSSPSDLILQSSDSVFFYVHGHVLLSDSQNGFNGMLPASHPKNDDHLDPILHLPEHSAVLNVVLHAIYDMSCAHYSPSFDQLVSSVHALKHYGIPPESRILPPSPFFTLLLSHAPLHPLELYALAASYDLRDLAISTSPHLLSLQLSSITDSMAELIGPIYLKRLFFLHFGRVDALKRLLLFPPHPHAPTAWCDFAEQKKLTRAWALASAYLAWDARPDLSTSAMESALNPLAEHLSCDLCRQALTERIKTLIVQWSVVKRTV